MLPKISRYFLIVVTIFSLGYALPSVYHTLFDKRINMPFLTYSSLTHDYYTMQSRDGKPAFVNRKGESFDQFTYMDLTPVENYTYHLSKGTLPDSVRGIKLNPQELQRESIWQFLDPKIINGPKYNLYPLFESEPDFGLKLPDDVFRINKSIEFIHAKSNKVNKEKSKEFNDFFVKENFAFPADVVAGIPTVMKRRDDGWFITDSKNELYHLKMVKGKPFLRKIAKPGNIRIARMLCNDFDSKEFFALVITDNDGLYTLNSDYSFTSIPVEGYDYKEQSMILSGNIFNKSFSFFDDNSMRVFTVDRNYKLVDHYEKKLPQKSAMAEGKVFDFLFPFQVKARSSSSFYINFIVDKTKGINWIFMTLILLMIYAYLVKKHGKHWKSNIVDLAIIAIAGVFGFIAVQIFPNKNY